MPDNTNRSVTPRNSGFFQDISERVRLIGRLIVDPRVSLLVKLLPVGTLLYVIFPDLLPMNPIDDAVVVWLGTYLFVDLCPPEVVAEHQRQLAGKSASAPAARPADEVVEGEFYEQGSSSTQDQNKP